MNPFKYTLVNKLGEGAAGVVWRFLDEQSHIQYAGKECSHSEAHREATMLWNLRHDHVITFVELYETADRYFIIMELANGGNLLHYFPLSEATLRQVMRDVLQAVVYIHGQSVAHRDIKPENILVCGSGLHDAHCLVKIADFGYAAYCERPGLTGGYGTISYMAPEVMGWYLRQQCHPYGLSCDLWSLGSLGVESLSDVHPVANLQDKDLCWAVYNGTYPEWPIPDEIHPHFIWHYEHVLRPAGLVQALPPETCSEACSELLVREPSARLTATAALNHPWFHCHSTSQQNVSGVNVRGEMQGVEGRQGSVGAGEGWQLGQRPQHWPAQVTADAAPKQPWYHSQGKGKGGTGKGTMQGMKGWGRGTGAGDSYQSSRQGKSGGGKGGVGQGGVGRGGGQWKGGTGIGAGYGWWSGPGPQIESSQSSCQGKWGGAKGRVGKGGVGRGGGQWKGGRGISRQGP